MNRDPWLNGARLTRTVVAVALVLGVLAGAFETVAALPAGATGTAPSLADGWATYVPGATTPVTFDVLSLVAGGPSGADPTSLTVVAAPPFADAMAAVTSPGSITLTPSATASGSFSLTFGLCAPGVATWTESDPTCARAEVTYAEPVAQTVGYHFTLAGTRSGREKLDFAVDAPPSVPATGVMTVTVALAPISIQTTQTGFNLTYADEISTMLPVPAGLTYVPTSLEAVGGTANLAHSSTVRYCTAPGTGCTGTDSGNFATTAPYLELRTGATPTGRIEGGTTGTLPTIRAEFKATGSVATTVSFETTQFEMTVATVLSVMINAFPSTATRQLPPPYEPPVALSTTTIVTPIPAPTLTGVVPVSGPPSGGTTVTLSGTNLSGTSAVDFGTAAATTVTVAPTGSSLTAKAPPHLSGPVPVSVTTPGGTVTSPGAFTFVSSTPAFTLSCPALSTDTAPTWPLVVTGRLAPDPVDAGRTVAPVTLAVGTRIPVGLAQQLAGKIVEVTLDETGAVVDAAPTAAGLSFAGSVAVPVSTQIPTTGVPVTMAGTSTPRSAIAASSGTVTLSQGSTATLELTAGGTTVGPASCTQPTETLGTAAITPAPASLAITTATLPTGTEGTAYGSTLVAGGGTTPYTWTATGLPAGLSLSRTGSITGVPTAQGHFTVKVTVTGTSATPSATATLALFVNGPPPAISTEVLAAGAEGASYETTLTAHGGTTPYRWTATGLPAGLHLSSTGSITGTPTTTGASTVVLTVTSPTGRKASATFTLSVTPALAVATTSLPAGAVGYPYSSTLSASGGLYPFSWTASGLPPGLSMSTDGSITGTPTTTGTSEVTVTVTGHTGVSASEPLTLDTTVTPAPPSGGYLMPTAQGGVTPFGPAAQLSGSMGDRPLDAPVVGIAAAPTGQGYWEVAADGGVFAFGPGAPFYGSMGGLPLDHPIVGLTAVPATPEAPGHQPIYLALGDSAPMWDGTASYPDLITTHYQTSVPGLRLVNLSQSGATTTSMMQSYFTSTSQLQRAELYLRAYRGSVALVTIDIGGNDVLPCTSGILSGTGTTTGCLATVESRMIANLHTILTGLRQAAGPGVRIVGMTYYNPFLGDWLAGGTARAGVIGSTQALEQLNGLLTQAYTQTGAQVADVEGAVDATDLSTLVPSTWGDVPVAVTRACSLLDISCTAGQSGLGGDDPTVAGAAVIAQAFESTIGTLSPP